MIDAAIANVRLNRSQSKGLNLILSADFHYACADSSLGNEARLLITSRSVMCSDSTTLVV